MVNTGCLERLSTYLSRKRAVIMKVSWSLKFAVTEAGSVYEAELAPNNQIPDSLPKSNFGSNTCLVNKAKVAARNSKWSADAGNSRRVGFIVYRFELQ